MSPWLGFRPRILAAAALVLAAAAPVSAQVDPLLFLKTAPPNVILVVDTANRMQRSAPTNPATVATSIATSHYYDPFIYTKNAPNPIWQQSIGVTDANTLSVLSPPLQQPRIREQRRDRFALRRFRPSATGAAALQPVRGCDPPVRRARRALPGYRREPDGGPVRPGQDATDQARNRDAGQRRAGHRRRHEPANQRVGVAVGRWPMSGRRSAARTTGRPTPRACSWPSPTFNTGRRDDHPGAQRSHGRRAVARRQ